AAQQCSPTTAHEEGEKQNLIHILSLAAQAKGWVSLRWKWRVSFAWKLTNTLQLKTLFALSNLWMVRQQLLAAKA
ncbi:hypothetical protein N5I10_12865, partial [Comamonas aquatica]|nr:hypothetical protein [Comamonas aquatica]MDH1678912.1 hypothetical protein [Comamonas aquatica]